MRPRSDDALLVSRKDPEPRSRMAGSTSLATRNGPRLARFWAVSNISVGTYSSSSRSGGSSRPSM